jgi:60 kDa SS-A/Ro ribonucleoprotein
MDITDAKLAVMGMTATEFTIADPNDRGMMDLVGLDAAIPELLRAFVLNEF